MKKQKRISLRDKTHETQGYDLNPKPIHRLILTSLQRPALHTLTLIILTLVYTIGFFSRYMQMQLVPGWDGAQHYAVNKAYSDIIFPSLQGILPNWYAGLPWPTFYPPLFTYTMAVLAHILPISYFTIFQWLFVVLTFAFPLLVYWIAGKLQYSPFERLLAGFFAILYLVSSGDQAGTLGIAMGGTFENGLYPQFFAACVFLVWFGLFLRWLRYFDNTDQSQRHNTTLRTKFVQSGHLVVVSILMGLVLISNVHIAQPALMTFGVFAVLYSARYRAKIYPWFGFQMILALVIASIWYVPLIQNNTYFLTQTITEVPLHVALLSLFVPLMLGAIGGFVGVTEKRLPVVGLFVSAMSILLITIIPWAQMWSGLPLQPFRVFPMAYLYLMILVPLGLMQVMRLLKLTGVWQVIGIVILLSPMLYWYPPVDQSISGLYTLTQADHNLISFLKSKTDGRSIFEVWLDDNPTPYLPEAKQPTHFILSALVASDSEHQTLWSAFRESSLLSPFVQPLRNAFSYRHESYGVICYLCIDKNGRYGFKADEFYQQSWEEHLRRARLMGVKYIVVRTDLRKTLFHKLPVDQLVSLVTFDQWEVFEVTDASLNPIILDREPVLTLAQLNPRARPAEGDGAYDWLRLNEEWFFHGKLEQVLARSEAKYIEDMGELDHFKHLFLPELTYFNQDQALQILIRYAKEHHLIVLKSDDELFTKLKVSKDITAEHFHIIEKTGDVRVDMGKVLEVLERINPTVKTTNKWLLHKYTYFPTLRATYTHPIYLASPAFTLEQILIEK